MRARAHKGREEGRAITISPPVRRKSGREGRKKVLSRRVSGKNIEGFQKGGRRMSNPLDQRKKVLLP